MRCADIVAHGIPPRYVSAAIGKRTSPVTQDRTHEPSSRWEGLTLTGAGTPMGDLLRRYWWPIAGTSELERPGTRAVRLMGEDLVLYKDLGRKYRLIEPHCRP